MFAIRLANELTRQGHRVVLFNVGQYPDHPSVVATIHPRVALFRADGPLSLAEILARFDIDTVHSSLWWADRYIANHLDALGTRRWVVSMHGCHETLLANPSIDRTAAGLFGKMLARVDTWVPTAGKNRELFARHGKPLREASVANGVEGGAGVAIPREVLGLRPDALVLVLASRAIPEKGWQAAVDAVRNLNADGIAVDLLLIGAGAERDRLLREAPAHVVLIDQVENLRDYLATADIGLVPSTFKGESMPLVLLEMMAQGLPVVATDVGAIPQILADAGQGPAGVVVPLKDGRVDLPGIAQAIAALADPHARATMGAAARATFEADYTLERMVEGYVALYDAIPPRD